jgi:3-deoxy-manno-octulosonate cytidylyltransferase (CMP-KDO synthetase)
VATDAEIVGEALGVKESIEWVMTGDAASGTERVAQVAARPEFAEYDTILNLQGDEPFISKKAVQGALDRVKSGDDIGTAAGPLTPEDQRDPNRVKVCLDGKGRAVAFTRELNARAPCDKNAWLLHLGVYAYTRKALERWASAESAADERDERLEQLRPLRLGMTIGVATIDHAIEPGLDTEEDLEQANKRLQRRTQPAMNLSDLGVA